MPVMTHVTTHALAVEERAKALAVEVVMVVVKRLVHTIVVEVAVLDA